MNSVVFKLLIDYSRDVNKLGIIEKYNRLHRLYFQLDQLLKTLSFQKIGFLSSRSDELDCYANLDELIRNKKEVYQFQVLNNVYFWVPVTDLRKNFHYFSNIRIYESEQRMYKDLDVLLIPVQLVYKDYALKESKTLVTYLNKTKAIKIGFAYKEATRDFYIDQTVFEETKVSLDHLIVV